MLQGINSIFFDFESEGYIESLFLYVFVSLLKDVYRIFYFLIFNEF